AQALAGLRTAAIARAAAQRRTVPLTLRVAVGGTVPQPAGRVKGEPKNPDPALTSVAMTYTHKAWERTQLHIYTTPPGSPVRSARRCRARRRAGHNTAGERSEPAPLWSPGCHSHLHKRCRPRRRAGHSTAGERCEPAPLWSPIGLLRK